MRRQKGRRRSTILVKGSANSGIVTPLPLLATTRTLVDLHVQNNDHSAGLWDLYAGHRAQVTKLLASSGKSGEERRLAVLGAGNANDLDLEVLAGVFSDVHLADLDAVALARAVRRQDAATRARASSLTRGAT